MTVAELPQKNSKLDDGLENVETGIQQPTGEELKAAEKEMYMSGRAIRIGETLDEYKAERSASWEKKQRSKEENRESDSVEQQIGDSLDTVSDSGIVKVHDRSGKLVFEGDPGQLIVFINNKDFGTTEDIGSISDEDGTTIFRFGPADGHGFTDRKRITQLFQQLEGKVADNQRVAAAAQKLAELHSEFGTEQEIPVAPQVEQPTVVMTERSEQSEDRTENQLAQENYFDSHKAQQIVDVAKDWVKYGGNFYSHLTGKDPKLEKGVDYRVSPDGVVDMVSYREARQKKIDAWLQEPSNQAWLAAGKKFQQDHEQEISNGKEFVEEQQPDGTVVRKEKYTTPYSRQDGWLYYESNYFDKQKGEVKQPERESTKYRAYFNVEGGDVLSTYQEVIAQLSNDPELQKLGFQIKTADVSTVTDNEIGQIMNQKDRIVLYLGEKGMERALPILQKYAEENRQKFSRGEGVLLAQPVEDSKGQEIPGLSMTSEAKGRSPDPTQVQNEYASFSDMQSMIIESSFRSLMTGLKNPKVVEASLATYPAMKENLSRLPATAGQADFLRVIFADPNGEEFLMRNLQAIYPKWSKAFGMMEKNTAFKE